MRTADRNFSNSEKPERTAIEESSELLSNDARLVTCINARLVATPNSCKARVFKRTRLYRTYRLNYAEVF